MATGYSYDEYARLTRRSYSDVVLGYAYETYSYDANTGNNISDGTLDAMRMINGDSIDYTYDALQRLTYKELNSGKTGGGIYEGYMYNGNQVAVKRNWIDDETMTHQFSYTYDALGNIVTETVGGKTTSYTYDELNQLTGVTNGDNRVEAYEYDNAGNILSFNNGKKSLTFTYDNSQWKDLLTTVKKGNDDPQTITYDKAGNPLSFYDGYKYTFNWTEGRRLESLTYHPESGSDKTTTYQYNDAGLRTKKTNQDGTYTVYHIADGRYVGETRFNANGTPQLYIRYTYDENDSVVGISLWHEYEDGSGVWVDYYFVKNLQGDVLQVYNESGNSLVASYTYDAWGNILSATGSLATINPFRYRGYYFDNETYFYYLQSRYYDPAIGRFINADVLASTGQGFLGYNMFVYCLNNPINMQDQTGQIAVTTLILIGSAIIGAGCAAYTAYVEYKAGFKPIKIIGDSACAGFAGFSIVYSGGMSLYQCYQNYCYLNALTPVTEINLGNNINHQLQNCANTANVSVPGKGPAVGIKKHTAFASEVNSLGNKSLRTEVSYKNGVEVPYGTKDSIRFDVLQYNTQNQPINAWDFKTGSANLSFSRMEEMRLKSGLNIPITLVR